jgi:hypothetical protein
MEQQRTQLPMVPSPSHGDLLESDLSQLPCRMPVAEYQLAFRQRIDR